MVKTSPLAESDLNSDADLLNLFCCHRDEAAFAELVHRTATLHCCACGAMPRIGLLFADWAATSQVCGPILRGCSVDIEVHGDSSVWQRHEFWMDRPRGLEMADGNLHEYAW